MPKNSSRVLDQIPEQEKTTDKILNCWLDEPPCRAVLAALHTAQLGGPTLSQGAQNSSPVTTSTPEKASSPQIEIWSTRNRWS